MLTRFIALIFCLTLSTNANAFCGFYVARADGKLFNEASKVVFVRDKNQSVITMSSDYQGAPKDFAMIVPTPKVLHKKQIRTVAAKTIDHLDRYTAPRLVEYFDSDPCLPEILPEPVILQADAGNRKTRRQKAKKLGVTIRAQYKVDAYDILILDAKQSDGLITFLRSDGYQIPDGLGGTLASYINGGMKFFVAKVNLKRHSAAKKQALKPLQIAFASKKFMLPIQLGKVNAKGQQDLLLMTLTHQGRVDITNYKTKQIPSGIEIPVFLKKHFGAFYKDMFARQVKTAGAFLEYAWDMGWCDPCAADPLSNQQLANLGVSWLKGNDGAAGQDVFVTRLHLRYTKDTFKQDLKLRVTENRQNFQGRYILNNPFKGPLKCEQGRKYVQEVKARLRGEAALTSKLTGWSQATILRRAKKAVPAKFR